MTCLQARTALYPVPALAAAQIDMADAARHVAACEECQLYFKNQERFVTALRTNCQPVPASDALRQRVDAEVGRGRLTPAGNLFNARRVGVLVASLGLALPGAFLALFLARSPSKEFFNELCFDHSKYLDAQSQIRTDHPETIEHWFRDKTGFRVNVPRSPETQLLGARLCFLKKHRAALIFFRKEGHPISLFELSSSEVSLRALKHSVIDATEVWHDSINGYSLVAIQKQGVVSVLVSDLRESDLLGLASAVRSDSL